MALWIATHTGVSSVQSVLSQFPSATSIVQKPDPTARLPTQDLLLRSVDKPVTDFHPNSTKLKKWPPTQDFIDAVGGDRSQRVPAARVEP